MTAKANTTVSEARHQSEYAQRGKGHDEVDDFEQNEIQLLKEPDYRPRFRLSHTNQGHTKQYGEKDDLQHL